MAHRAGLDQATVVEAAARLIDTEGIEQLSLGKVADYLGVRTPSLYNHIAGLPGLKYELAIYCSRDLLNHLTRATIGKSRSEAIFALADAYRAYAKKSPGRYMLTQQAPDPDEQEWQAIAQQILEVIQAILAPYKLTDKTAVHVIRSLRCIVHGFISLEVAKGFKRPVDLDESFHWLITVFIAGLEQSTTYDDGNN
jgi:AcrR family transcriptional regulator